MNMTYNEGIMKCVHDSELILRGVLEDNFNTDSPAGFLKVDIIMEMFRDRMKVWSDFETGRVAKRKSRGNDGI